MIYTSYFAKASKHPKAVSIAQGTVNGFRGRVMKELAPPWALIKAKGLSNEIFAAEYKRLVLSELNQKSIARKAGAGAVLLCWEAPGRFCHRHIVSAWLREAGVQCCELGHEKDPVWDREPGGRKKNEKFILNYTGMNGAQSKILQVFEILKTYPSHHNQAKKIETQIAGLIEGLGSVERNGLLKLNPVLKGVANEKSRKKDRI